MPTTPDTAALDEAAARRVLLVQTVEAGADEALWNAEDRRWASRAATQAVGEGADRARWIDTRARLALQRLAPRDAAVRRAIDHPLWRPGWAVAALAVALAVGALSDALLAGAYFNLLSLPFFGLLGWNLAIYAMLVAHRLRASHDAGPLRRALVRALGRWRGQGLAAAFALRWASAARSLTLARAAGLVHLAAAALALGLVGGMYVRALAFDYRAGWATTLLEPGHVHTVLDTVFAPAQALSGIVVPDHDGIAALRVTPTAPANASAAPWIHLMALTLLLAVVLPRLALALLAARRAAALARHFPVALSGPYFDRLRPHAGAKATALWILPHAQAPSPDVAAALRRWVAMALGDGAALEIAEPLPYGDEDSASVRPAPAGRALALFDLGATPEHEVHGRLLGALPGRPLQLLDEAAFVRRFGTGSRLDERRAAWTAFADSVGVPLVRVNLDAPDEASADALREALEH